MNQIKRKLHSDSGASMMLALALLLICVMVSSVIVAAAASGSSRRELRLKSEREYLAITSTAQYIAENLNPETDTKFIGVNYLNDMPCSKYKNYALKSGIEVEGKFVYAYAVPMPTEMIPGIDNGEIQIEQFYLYVGDMSENVSEKNIFCQSEEGSEVDDATKFTGPFADLMQKAATEVFLHNVSYETEFKINVDDDRLPTVKCKFMMDKDYNVSVVIRCIYEDENQNVIEESNYSMTVRMKKADVVLNEDIDEELVACTREHEYFYEYCDDYGNIYTSAIEKHKFEHFVKNPTTEVTWTSPVISKGGE